MVAQKKTRKGGPRKTSAHVRGPSDIPAFMQLLKNTKVIVVIVTAEWCGYCQKRKGEFQELMSMSKAPGIGVAQVDETQVKSIPELSEAKFKGYPSALLLQTDPANPSKKTLATFNAPDGQTNALPKSDTESIKEIVSNGNSTGATATTNSANNFEEFEEEEEEEEENGVEPESNVNTINLKNLPMPPNVKPITIKATQSKNIPPDTLSDLVNTKTSSAVGGARSLRARSLRARSLGLFKQLEQMVGSTVGKTMNVAKKVTRKARKMGRNVSRRVRKVVRRFR